MIDSKKALNILIEGNNRFINNKLEHPNRCDETRKRTMDKQKPMAIIISCSDSRVPVEIIFDLGIGDLFVIRSAGHVLSDAGIASIEYAVEVLECKLIVVLGHDHCGAVKTALKDDDHHLSPNVEKMVDRIRPAVDRAKCIAKNDEELLKLSIDYNVEDTIDYIKTSDPILKNAIKSEKVQIIGANYNIENGKVDFNIK